MDLKEIQDVSKKGSPSLLPSLSNQRLETAVNVKKKTGKVIQRNYVLNDVGALKKKMKHESRKLEFEIGKEAKDGSNIMFPMKASFFEFVKLYMINELEDNDDIISVENAEGAKAGSENSGDVYVEFAMDISFKAKGNVHTIKMTAYTTTSRLMIQPIGEKPTAREHLDQRSPPRFFVETFLVPWCQQVITTNRYDEKIGKMYTAAMKEEIKKMDLLKLEGKKVSKEMIS